MFSTIRTLATIGILAGASLCWVALGAVTSERGDSIERDLGDRVDDLWGGQQTQRPPALTFRWQTTRRERVERLDDKGKKIEEWTTVTDTHDKTVPVAASAVRADLRSDLRRKGLRWYSLYSVDFGGQWRYQHDEPLDGWIDIAFSFPDPSGMYDDFRFVVDGVDRAQGLAPKDGLVRVAVPVRSSQPLAIAVSYKSRGRDQWVYAPAEGVGLLRNFSLDLTTDFADIDFPSQAVSPSTKERAGGGWRLAWRFSQVVTGHVLGVVTPRRTQPGELAAALSFSAPISLLFFIGVIFILALLRRIDLHPLNTLMIAAAFFAFHLLFAYTADRLPIEAAFALASAVSVFLVLSYLRLVVSNRFAFREAAAAQLVYLVGFSLAHFWKGFTGLTVTVLAIVTLFVVMQLTGRMRWSEVLQPSTRATALKS